MSRGYAADEEWARRILSAKLRGEHELEPHVAINGRLYKLAERMKLPDKTAEQVIMPGYREKVEVVVSSLVQQNVGDQVTVTLYRGKKAKGKEVARGTLVDMDVKPGWGAWQARLLVEVGSRA